MKLIYTLFLFLLSFGVSAQTPVNMFSQPALTYTETFADITNWTFNSNNDGTFIAGAGAAAWRGLAPIPGGVVPNPLAVTVNSTYFSYSFYSGVLRDSIGQRLVMLATGTTDNTNAVAIDFHLDFTNVNAATLSFNWKSVNNSTGDRKGSLRVYGSTDGTNFTEINGAEVLNLTNNSPTTGNVTNVNLPASFNNSATAFLRFYYYNGTGGTAGSRPRISLDNVNVTAVPANACVAPTAQPTAITFGPVSDKTITANFTAASPAPHHYLVVQSHNPVLSTLPVDGMTYNVGDDIGDGNVIAITTSNSFTATNLSALTTYYYYIFSMNDVCVGGPLYQTTNALTGSASTTAGPGPCTAPAAQPTALVFTNITTNSIKGSFTPSDSTDEYLVVRSNSNTLNANPVDATVYSPGNAIGNGIVVSRGAATNFNATGLSPATQYYFFVFAIHSVFCNNGPAYNITAPLTTSVSTQPLPPCSTPLSQPQSLNLSASNTSIIGDFVASPDADNFIVLYSTSPSLSATPQDGIDYTAGTTVGNATVISSSTSTAFFLNNLNPGTTYYFFVFSVNSNCLGGTKYMVDSPLTGSTTTTTVPANNVYYGNLHAHSFYSDGNQDSTTYTPADDYTYAKNSNCLDFLGISEHNHASAGMSINNWRPGLAQARAATTPNFLALYGMEWGVISNGGHVIIYGTDKLLGWEPGNYDVYVPISNYTGSRGIFRTLNTLGGSAFATLAHPDFPDFDNIANLGLNPTADSAIVGCAIASGPAFSTNTTYNNPSSMNNYLPYYMQLLSRGYHAGPTVDHDNHNTTFGRTAQSRLAVIAPSLDSTEFYKAMNERHFYATEDCDTKVTFTLNNQMMGSIVTGRTAPAIAIYATDPTNPTYVPKIKLMFGVPGSGILPTPVDSIFGNTFTYTDNNLAINTSGYYYADIIIRGRRTITSPIWYTKTTSVFPVKLLSFSASPLSNKTVNLVWKTTNEVNSERFEIEHSIDGRTFKAIHYEKAQNNTTISTYSWIDKEAINGLNYYRLKQVDKDGKTTYSKVVTVNFNSAEINSFTVTPNPVQSILKLSVQAKENQTATVGITDLTGRIIYTTRVALAKGNQLVQLADAKMDRGTYFVTIAFKGEKVVNKIIKI